MAATTNATTIQEERRGMYALRYTRQQLLDNLAWPFQYEERELQLYPRTEEDGGPTLENYRGIILDKLVAPKAIFTHASLEGASFIEASLEGAEFALADLAGADFEHANLTDTHWASTTMSRCNFLGATLCKAGIYSNNVIHGAYFESANLMGANIGWGDEFYWCYLPRQYPKRGLLSGYRA
jgi:uncharacterized protein YjbI with pentapeptide repeats